MTDAHGSLHFSASLLLTLAHSDSGATPPLVVETRGFSKDFHVNHSLVLVVVILFAKRHNKEV